MKLRRETIVPVLAVLVIGAATPFAVVDTLRTGSVYLFSSEFLEELPQRFTNISTLLARGIILDIAFQLVLYRQVHPGAALLVGPILVCAPYALSRGLTTRLARGLGGRKE